MVRMAIEQAAIGTSTAPLTYRDLEGMPDDGRFYELSNGVLIVTPAANLRHQDLAFRIGRLLDDHREAGQAILVEAELRIRDDTVKRPDVQVVDRSLLVGQAVMGTPALVVEVASPSTSLLDRTEKRVVYAEAGIPAYWLVDLVARTITVLELADGDYVEVAVLDADGRAEVSVPTTFELDAATIFA
ncbi:MAG: hypothetical protein JWN67_307 [Actinomycetia bacterium]|nr:hypothetical protein [Actinomycetes bacterium]